MSVYALRSRRIAGSSGVSSTGWRRLSHDWLCCQHRILKCTALTKEGVEKTFLRNRRLYEWNKARRRWAHTIPVLASLSIPCPLLPFVQGQDSEGHREHNRSAIVTPVAGSGLQILKTMLGSPASYLEGKGTCSQILFLWVSRIESE